MNSLRAIFKENDANHDGYLDESDIIRIYRKQSERNINRNKSSTITENDYVQYFFDKVAREYEDRVS